MEFIKFVNENTNIKKIVEDIKEKEYGKSLINDISVQGQAYLIASDFLSEKRNLLVVFPNLYKAQLFYDILLNLIHIDYVSFFPADEFIASELLASSDEFRKERMSTIEDYLNGKPKIIITHTTGYLRFLPPKEKWETAKERLFKEKVIERQDLVDKLMLLGYERVSVCSNQGEFSVRGSVIDFFPITEERPIRVDFFDNEIDYLKTFDQETQRTIEDIEEYYLNPISEFFYTHQKGAEVIQIFEKVIQQPNVTETTVHKLKHDIECIENQSEKERTRRLMKYFYPNFVGFSQFINADTTYFVEPNLIQDTYEAQLLDIESWYDQINDKTYNQLDHCFIDDLNYARAICPRVVYIESILNQIKWDPNLSPISMGVREVIDYSLNLEAFFNDYIRISQKGFKVLICNSKNRLKHIKEFLVEKGIPVHTVKNENYRQQVLNLVVSEYGLPVEFKQQNVTVLTEESLFKKETHKRIRYRSVIKDTKKITSLTDLKVGDYLVHYDYGIGRFAGLKTMEVGDIVNDYIQLIYKGDASLYVPVDNIALIQKYSASEGARPKIAKLGGTDWAKTKLSVKSKIKDIADKLIKIYSERENAKGFQYEEDTIEQMQMEQDFPYEETPDQLTAIREVKEDMESTRPMDRLICGDVGFGKTEIAMRAAFKAVMNGKQVAYLAPTTVLSRQHYYTFKERFSKFGINVRLLNRFVPQSYQNETIRNLQNGYTEVVIGTHRLLSKDILFNDLGLLIVDEEQRFGVEHKERIKELKVDVDILTLTATPIPRTLQMAISGVKSMSLLDTPPKNRYPIQTYVIEEHEPIIKEAVERELARGGQVFYLYNKVSDIDRVARKIKRLVPQARVIFAHGKMNREELEYTMQAFIDKKFDVLVCTTIIETGVDIPNANTLIVADSDNLGLAQLYQIRGRVGRSDRIAYAYMMYNKGKVLTEKAIKRLQVIKEFTELGAGFKIAMRDLSIRGAGDILGSEQSGFIDTVGMDMFMQMLEEEIMVQKGEEIEPKVITPKAKNQISKHIPTSYVSDDYLKIEMHKKISMISNSSDIKDLTDEFSDRFGSVHEDVVAYMNEKLFEKYSDKIGIEKITEVKNSIKLTIGIKESELINITKISHAAHKVSKNVRFEYKNKRLNIFIDKVRLNRDWIEIINLVFDWYFKK